eukprot:4594612-Pleurochrysis_carterae.AAC.1
MTRGLVPVSASYDESAPRGGPEGGRSTAGHQVGACKLHDAANRSFGDAIELMDVWGACRGVHAVTCQQLRELMG